MSTMPELKNALSQALSQAGLIGSPESLIGRKFCFAYEVDGEPWILCGRIEGVGFSLSDGLDLLVSPREAKGSHLLKSLHWDQKQGWLCTAHNVLLHAANLFLSINRRGQLELID